MTSLSVLFVVVPSAAHPSSVRWKLGKEAPSLGVNATAARLAKRQATPDAVRTTPPPLLSAQDRPLFVLDLAPLLTDPFFLCSASRRSAACVVAHGGLLWCIGGFDGTVCTNSVQVYSPQTNKWVMRKPLQRKRAGAGACVGDGKIYVIGGWDGVRGLDSVEHYDMVSDKWRELRCMNHIRSRGVGAAHFGGYLWALGGQAPDGRALNSVERCRTHTHARTKWLMCRPAVCGHRESPYALSLP